MRLVWFAVALAIVAVGPARADAPVRTARAGTPQQPPAEAQRPPEAEEHAAAWEPVGEVDGVQIFRRVVPGSRLFELKGIGVVEAPVATVALVLLDDSRTPEWVDSVDDARIVRMISPREYIDYTHIRMPPLFPDRELVTRVLLESNPATKSARITSRSAPDDEVPERRGVRARQRGLYLLESIDDGRRTRFTVELHSDPGGGLPSWLVNYFQKDWAAESIAGIRMQAKKPDLRVPEELRPYLQTLEF
jgi:hypothetical protein